MPDNNAMTTNDILTLIIAAIAVLVSIISAIYSRVANKTSQGSLELSLRELINSTKYTSIQAAIALHDFKVANEGVDFKLRENAWYSAVEDNLNAYEKACGLYLDGKLDKTRFKKDYSNEIRQLVENTNLNTRYFHPTTSNYKAALKVYKSWFDLEK